MKRTLILLLAISNFAWAQQQTKEGLWSGLDTTITAFGEAIYDPFQGLEDTQDLTVIKRLNNQSSQDLEYLHSLQGYDQLVDSISSYINTAPIRASLPCVNNGVYYTLEYLTESSQTRIVTIDTVTYEKKVLFTSKDIPASKGENYLINSYNPSPDNRYIAIETSPDGGDFMEIRVYDTSAKAFTSEKINASISYYPYWLPNSQGLFYTQLSLPSDSVDLFDNVRVKYHRVGESQSKDKTILERGSSALLAYEAGDFPTIRVLPDSVTVRCSLARGISQYIEIYIAPLDQLIAKSKTDPWKRLAPDNKHIVEANFDKNHAYLLINPTDSVSAIEEVPLHKKGDGKIILKETKGFISDFAVREKELYVVKVLDGVSHLIRIQEGSLQEVDLPISGKLDITSDSSPSKADGNGLFFGLASWTKGYKIYYYDALTNLIDTTSIRPSGKLDDSTGLVVEEVLVYSHDSTSVPMSIIYHKDIERNSSNPAILETYGAYGSSLEPYLALEMLPWFKSGGILAKAHVRGGGENGTNWHTLGKKSRKVNSWKDLIACGQFLIDQGYTSSSKLGVTGASAGGVTVGMAINEKPSLFRAAVLEYPIVNPTRLAESVDGSIHYDEFGNPNDSLEFQYLKAMDPYLHIEKDQNYPALLVTAGRDDSRVTLWEPAKYFVRMQASRSNNHPSFFLLYDNEHGTSDMNEFASQTANKLIFFMWQLDTMSFAQK